MLDLTSQQISDYWKRGYVLVPQVFNAAEVTSLRAECERLAGESLPLESSEAFPRTNQSGQTVRNLIDPVVPHSHVVRNLIAKEELVAKLRGIFVDEPCLFKDKLILRPPGTSGYGLHQDYAYWGWTGVPAHRLLALQISIDDADQFNGAVRLYAGMHSQLLAATAKDGNDIDSVLLQSDQSELIPTKAGDVLIFHSLTPHWSDVNYSDAPRRTLYLTYNAAQDGNLYRAYYQERGPIVSAELAS